MIPDLAPLIVLNFVSRGVDCDFGQEEVVPDCLAAGIAGAIHCR